MPVMLPSSSKPAQELELPSSWAILSQDVSPDLEVPRIQTPNYGTFFEQYIRANRPCVVAATSADWPCSKLWVHADGIDTKYLTEQYGRLLAPVANCEDLEYDSQRKQELTVSEYMLYLNGEDGKRSSEPMPNLYLKDWHLRRERPQDEFYRVPSCFASDWLNEYALDRHDDDFMFVYIGPKGSWTPLHADVYSSFSWSVNVVGRKRWLLLPPGEEDKLRDPLGKLPSRISPAPHIRTVELLQEAGDAIFVPSGWHHQVVNELDTISVNHNWINGCNIDKVWKALNDSLRLVEKEIEELKYIDDFSEKCQIILKSLFGMNYKSFAEFLLHIAQQRLAQWSGEVKVLFGAYTLGKRHILFDLIAVLRVIDDMLKDETFFDKLEQPDIEKNLRAVRSQIESVTNKVE